MAKKKARTPQDTAALADEVAEMEALVKRRKKAQRDLDALEAGDDTDPEDAPLPGSELVDQVMVSLGGDGSFSVTKLDGTETVDCGSYDLPLWPDAMQGVIKKNGGGNYVLVFHRSDGTIAKRIKRTYSGGAPVPVQAASGSEGMLSMLKIMEDRAARQEAANETLRLEAMKSQQAMMTAMMQMMGAQNKPMINNASELAAVAKLFGAGEKKGTDLSDLVALKDLLDDLRGDEGGPIKVETDNPLVALVPALLQALGKGFSLPKVPAERRPLPPAAPPAPFIPATAEDLARRAVPVPPSPPPTAVPSPSAEAAGLLQHAVMLKTAIDAGMTPDMAADKAWDDAEERGQEAILIDLIEKGDWTNLKSHPDLSAHADWLDKFREALRAGIDPVEPGEPVPPVPAEGAHA